MIELLTTLPPGDHDARDFYVWLLAEEAPLGALRAWTEGEPDSALSWLCRGQRALRQAWDLRKDARWTVSRQQTADFDARLREADEALLRASILEPGDPTPWSRRISSSLGLSHGEVVARACFEEAVRRCPGRDHLSAHLELARYLSARHRGTHAKMLSFARESLRRSPRGDLAGLIAWAHLDRWDYLRTVDRDERGAAAYLSDPMIRSEVAAAHDSLQREEPSRRPSTVRVQNLFAFWFYVCEDRKRCLHEVELLDGAFTESPWDRLDGGLRRARRTMARWSRRSR